jgi:2-hydroxy-3-keto-5-methylthiopentenyl-1-phosphate phosphatase
MNNPYMVFIDFDGTITENDVGYEMFKSFTSAATEPIVQAYRQGEVNSLDCLTRECKIWNASSVDQTKVFAYLDGQTLRPGIEEFLIELGKLQIKPMILSEGFDFYINRILSLHKLGNLERVMNIARFEKGRLSPEFPHYKFGCLECSSCKGYHIRRLRPPNSCAIYIGDGHSDLHASLTADIVFARSHLSELLKGAKRRFFPFNSFYDISAELKNIRQIGLFAQSEKINFCRFSERSKENIRKLWESSEVMRYVGYPFGLGWSRAKYNDHWKKLLKDEQAIYLALEDSSGHFLGEAKIAFPDDDGFSQPDMKLLSEFWGQGLGFEAWQIILERIGARWPEAGIVVTPNIENSRAIKLYRRLGFKFIGDEYLWEPPESDIGAVPVCYRRMVKKGVASGRNI